MGNANFAQPPKIHKDRKEGDADTDKGRQPANGSGKAASQSSQGQKDGHKVGSRATNPFIIFFLRLRSKKPNEHVTVIARAAGKLWSRMTPEQRKKYVDLANEEKKRRQERKRKRKRSSTHSRILQMQARDVIAFLCPG
ncbi:PREDICTED: high mobility group protein homolog TDP-1-like isoform X1 [Trachymyrmex cornetzi]|uniref:high mobility group protein homolog TDP-1-like isoform X1 n=1 Tax=Trachymyrmex cornetzi TaxID=471704 RepID=UPI00084EF6C3|nr:PREDICTED: high mobility group protein homolog TDP-1-like isoform X1 [Trachymyrmex cornetzi]